MPDQSTEGEHRRGTVSPSAPVEIMPTGVVHSSTAGLASMVSRSPDDHPLQLFKRCFIVPLEIAGTAPWRWWLRGTDRWRARCTSGM
jgi:hypothetical protein